MTQLTDIKLICFDLDGTLVNSVPDLRLSLNAMLEELSLPHVNDLVVKTWVGDGIPKMVERCLQHVNGNDFSQDVLANAVSIFEGYYQQFLNTESGLYPAVKSTLFKLQDKGYKIALITNKAEKFLPDLLAYFGINRCFDLLLGGDTLARNKPDPMQVEYACEHFNIGASETVMIGDSRNDILAGQNAKVSTIALTYGYNFGEPIAQINPDYIVNHFDELLTLL
ncbi:phosphoglycolate phosphatase [Psychromonas sp. 14N.309.X.WAT.B.A12]|uniref:phosphoglycolate phosphatase n=1 Tax=unclassified Psychromonas TaxID=2614957 RepID=UPI0025B21FF7|nr:phosphoglycolate phosphatase [Psychromonas sp. 14N.309.X.WAT.B.A12]MDN2664039.1 phosphoglycolate phosphatase [Psychromonas sp. 14N.309.X.WAT.B.A12]